MPMEMENSQIIFYSILVLFISASVIRSYSGRLSTAFKHILIWGGIFFICFVVISFREEMFGIKERLTGELFPSKAIVNDRDEIILRKTDNGHFYVDSEIYGVTVRFMVDTGASRVALSNRDARRIGIDVDSLPFNSIVSTANGRAYVSPIIINDLTISGVKFNEIKASVSKFDRDISESLLGMSFLDKLKKFTIETDRLIMVP